MPFFGRAAGASDPIEYTRLVSQAMKRPGVASINTSGFVYTATALGGTSSQDDADGAWLRITTNTTENNSAIFSGDAPRRDWAPVVVTRIKVDSDLTNLRLWIALSSSTPANSATPTSQLAGFRFDSAAGDTHWQAVTNNATTATVVNTGVTVAADTVYLFRIEAGTSSIIFYINGTLVATITTTLPTGSSILQIYTTVTTLTPAARSVRWERVAVLTV